jgi:nucleotide-binding universal stress UspA family protein
MDDANQAEEDVMNAKPYVMLVGMDFSEAADRALREALDLASRRGKVELHVACIVPRPSSEVRHSLLEDSWLIAEGAIIEGVFASLRSHGEAELTAFLQRIAQLGRRAPPQTVSHVRIDAPGFGLVELAADIAADLVVVGACGQGATRAPVGSTAECTSRYARCPVLVVPSEVQRS